MPFDGSWMLIILGATLILIEVVLGGFAGFDLILIGSAFALGGAAGLVLGDTAVGFSTASVLCVAYIVAGRRYLRNRLKPAARTASNVDALIGREGVVQQEVSKHAPGLVKVGDEVWRAAPAAESQGPFAAGSIVTVSGVDGVTLLVR